MLKIAATSSAAEGSSSRGRAAQAGGRGKPGKPPLGGKVSVLPLSAEALHSHDLKSRSYSPYEQKLKSDIERQRSEFDEKESVLSWDTVPTVLSSNTHEESKPSEFQIHSMKAAAMAQKRKAMQDKMVKEVVEMALPDSSQFDLNETIGTVQPHDSKLVKWLKYFGLHTLSLHEAIYSGSMKHLVKAVEAVRKREEKDYGESLAESKHTSSINYHDDQGQTALSLACKVNRLDMVEYLLGQCDALPDVVDLSTGMSPLMYAIMANNPDMVLSLLLHEASVDLADFRCLTPLMMACASRKDNIVLVKTLYTMSRSSLVIDAQDDRGWTALHYAVYSDSPEVVQYLLTECCADRDIRDVNKKKPMHLAVFLKRGECETLLEDRKIRMARASGDLF